MDKLKVVLDLWDEMWESSVVQFVGAGFMITFFTGISFGWAWIFLGDYLAYQLGITEDGLHVYLGIIIACWVSATAGIFMGDGGRRENERYEDWKQRENKRIAEEYKRKKSTR